MTAIPSDTHDQEDIVLEALSRHLKAAGIAAPLVEQPDRLAEGKRKFPLITSDALFHFESTRAYWAVDVMSLAASPTPIIVLNDLRKRAQELALLIEVQGICPQAASWKTGLGSLSARMKAKPVGRWESSWDNSAGLSVTWRQVLPGEIPDVKTVALGFDVPGPGLSDQVEATIKNPLTKKATQQAAKAAASGVKAAVVLDQTGHGGIAQGGHWLVQFSQTIEAAVTRVLHPLDHHLDAVLLRDSEGDFSLVYGEFPSLR